MKHSMDYYDLFRVPRYRKLVAGTDTKWVRVDGDYYSQGGQSAMEGSQWAYTHGLHVLCAAMFLHPPPLHSSDLMRMELLLIDD